MQRLPARLQCGRDGVLVTRREIPALAALKGEMVAGCTVVRAEGHCVAVMELAAPGARDVGDRLLDGVLETASEAGCRRLGVFASPAWRHWPVPWRWGFACRQAPQRVSLDGSPPIEALRLENWQLLPGDSDSDWKPDPGLAIW